MQSLRLSIALGPLCSLPLPCRRYGCAGGAGVTHDRRVSDARYPQRIFDTLWMLVRSDLHHRPSNLTAHQQSSHLLPLTSMPHKKRARDGRADGDL